MSRNGKGAFRKALAKAAADAPPKPSRVTRMRRLTDEEIDLWLSVAAGVTRRPEALMPSRIAMPIPVTEPAPVVPMPTLMGTTAPPKSGSALPPLAPRSICTATGRRKPSAPCGTFSIGRKAKAPVSCWS